MSNWNNEAEAREQIKALVADYYRDFKKPDGTWLCPPAFWIFLMCWQVDRDCRRFNRKKEK